MCTLFYFIDALTLHFLTFYLTLNGMAPSFPITIVLVSITMYLINVSFRHLRPYKEKTAECKHIFTNFNSFCRAFMRLTYINTFSPSVKKVKIFSFFT